MREAQTPPIVTLLTELAAWTSERTADFPRPAHFTMGERLDRLSLDALELAVIARFASRRDKGSSLDAINIKLELLRCFWHIAFDRKFISQSQVLFVNKSIDEIGRMAGAWRRSLGEGTGA